MTLSPTTSPELNFYLQIEDNSKNINELFATTPWGDRWTDTFYQSADQICSKFDIVLPHNSLSAGPISLPENQSVAIWVKETGQLEKNYTLEFPASIIFSPSAFSILEARRQVRNVLVLSKKLDRGGAITEDYLKTLPAKQSNSQGVDASLSHLFLGLKAAYDLEAGKILDFGLVI